IGALARTAVNGGNRQHGQGPGKLDSLHLSRLGEGIIAGPDVAKFTIGYSLTMAHEDETSNGHVVLFSLSICPTDRLLGWKASLSIPQRAFKPGAGFPPLVCFR